MARLIVRSPQGEQTVSLTPGRLSIGRNPDNGLVLSAPTVSRQHAELDVRAEGAFLTDLGSSGGTFIGETRLLPHQPRQLAPGDELRIGPFTLLYVAEEALVVEPEQPAQPTEEAPVGETIAPVAAAEPSAPEEPAEAPAPVEAAPEVPARIEALPEEHAEALIDLLPVRRTDRYRVPVQGSDSKYLRFLPMIFQDNDFLGRYLQIFETIWEPQEWRFDHLSMYFNPRTCPPQMLDWLASWLDLSINAHWPEARRRRLLAEATDLYRWRGTRYGLTRMIEVCTGLTPEIVEDPATPFVFRVRMRLPAESGIDAALIDELVRAHKPAHAGYVIEIAEGSR